MKAQIKEIQREEEANRYSYNTAYHTRRIADTLEEILRLVKEDQERTKKYMEKDSEQTTRASNGPSIPAALAMAPGSRTELQATSGKLQASSCKLDKIKL